MKKTKKAATASQQTPPLNRAQTLEVFNSRKKAINDRMAIHVEDITKLKKPLPEMSLELYGHKEYDLKKGYKFLLTIIVLLVVSALEIPLNATGLEMLGRPQMTTTFMAIGLACALGLLAEGAGFSFRRGVVKKSFIGIFGALFCAGVALTIIYWLSEFRVAYFHRMKFNKEDISITGQVIFSIAVWCAGVIGVYFLTSGVKNLHLEKVFNSKRKSIRILQKKHAALEAEKDKLKAENAVNMVAAEAYETNIKHEKTKAENLKNELAIATLKDKENAAMQQTAQEKNKITQQKNAFYEKHTELLGIKTRVMEIAGKIEDKSELNLNEDYVSSMDQATTLIEEMKELASVDIPGTKESFEQAEQIFNSLKNLAS